MDKASYSKNLNSPFLLIHQTLYGFGDSLIIGLDEHDELPPDNGPAGSARSVLEKTEFK